jgi:voltage-gated potassium channel
MEAQSFFVTFYWGACHVYISRSQEVQEIIMVRHLLSKIINSNQNLSITFCLILLTSDSLYSMSEGMPFLDALWWSIVTATTVGYGDAFPQNLLGKITAVVLMLSMVLLIIPAITARMASGLIVNNDAFTDLEQEELKAGIRKIVAYIDQQNDLSQQQDFAELTSARADV